MGRSSARVSTTKRSSRFADGPARGALELATLEGFEPSISTLKGSRAGPLHHRVVADGRPQHSIPCRPGSASAEREQVTKPPFDTASRDGVGARPPVGADPSPRRRTSSPPRARRRCPAPPPRLPTTRSGSRSHPPRREHRRGVRRGRSALSLYFRSSQAAARAAVRWCISSATTSPQYRMMDTEISSQSERTRMPVSVP